MFPGIIKDSNKDRFSYHFDTNSLLMLDVIFRRAKDLDKKIEKFFNVQPEKLSKLPASKKREFLRKTTINERKTKKSYWEKVFRIVSHSGC